MRRMALGIALGMGVVVAGGTAWASECPARIKDANEAIAKAEAKGSKSPDLALAKRWVSEAQEAHKHGVEAKSPAMHADSAAYAKAAKLLADKAGM
jgi:hypothetical protein